MLPYAVNFKTRSEYPSARAMYDQFLKNRLNDGKNAFSSVVSSCHDFFFHLCRLHIQLDAPRQFPLDPGNYSPGARLVPLPLPCNSTPAPNTISEIQRLGSSNTARCFGAVLEAPYMSGQVRLCVREYLGD